MLRLLLIIPLLLHLSEAQESYQGTTVVVVRTPDCIIVAADSKLNVTLTRAFGYPFYVPPSNPLLTPSTIEKIRICTNAAIAIAGFYTRPEADYDAFQIAESACSGDDNIFQKAERLRTNLQPRVESAWAHILRENMLADLSKYPVACILVGFYQGLPFVIEETFTAEKNQYSSMFYTAIANVQITRYPHSNALDSRCHRVLSDAVSDQSLTDIEHLIETNPVQYVETAVLRAIDIDSLKNGPPVRILRLSKDRIGWMR